MNFPIADGHCDFLYSIVNYGQHVREPEKNQAIALPYLREGGVKLQFFAAWIDRSLRTPYLQQCLMMIDAYYRMLEDNPADFTAFTKAYDPAADTRIATVLTVEGGEAIEGSLSVLRMLHRLGVRAMTLTWNHNNELAQAAMKKNGRGLTGLGREAVAEMARIGMAVDVSHLNDAGIEEVLRLSGTAPFASHSNCRALCNTPRALPDDLILEISRRGGVIGVNFYPKQLTDWGGASIADIVRHVEHMAKVGGVACCAIGSDFDGMNEYPTDLYHPGHMPRLLQALSAAGFSHGELYRMAYGNLRDYIAQFI